MRADIKKKLVFYLEPIKKLIFGESIWGIRFGGVAPPNYVKIFVSYICTEIKKHWHRK